jgi:putative ABC transport system permease protein
MFRNYLKIALRTIWKNKGYSAINIFGLAVGIATCLLILIFVIDELSYDRFNKKADRIYRVDADIRFGGNHMIMAVVSDPMGPTLKQDFPEVEQFTRFRNYGGVLVRKGAENVKEDNVIFADSTLFDVFDLPMIGDPKTALAEPNSVVITEKLAKKYFNTVDAVGKMLVVNDRENYKVTGVIKAIPPQSHFHFDMFVSMSNSEESRQNSWLSHNFTTYIVLKKGADRQRFEAQLDAFTEKYMAPQAQEMMNMDIEAFKKSGNWARYNLMPLTRIHLHSDKAAELAPNGNIQYVYIFSAIAVFILLIACVNFMNLATARSANRAKEVGVRKVLGSNRQNLIMQFLSESLLIAAISLILAVALALLLLPFFNQLSGKQLSFDFVKRAWLLPLLVLIALIVGLLAGSYPAFYLSSFKPILVLKGKLATGFKEGWLRSGLVVFQFAISIFLIVGTVVIQGQLNYIRSKELGFNREQVLVLQNTYSLGNGAKAFRQELLNLPGVQSASISGYLPTGGSRSDSPLFPDASLDQKRAVSMQTWWVDEAYIPTMDMKIAQGRNFSTQFLSDSSGVIINEAAAKLLGFADPLNKPLYYLEDLQTQKLRQYRILGVVKDFNFSSLRQNVSPLAFFLGEERGTIAVRIKTDNIKTLVAQIEEKWKALAPSQPFTYSFMDDDFNNIYAAEQRVGTISLSFSLLAILIACLGLFGLVTFAAEQRTKEIGIRKVLGASISNIVQLLSKDFLKLVLLSAVVAFPVAWWIMHSWLQDFAFRIAIGWWVFAIAGFIAAAIALATVCFQAVRAALANPVKNLRTE